MAILEGFKRVDIRCRLCGATKSLAVLEAAYHAWRGGQVAQDAFPRMDIHDREWLISQTCPGCWDVIWKENNGDAD